MRRCFDIVDSPRHRHSFPVQLNPGVDAVLRGVVGGKNAAFFQELCGADGILVELSALVTFPGASGQSLHTDIPFNALPENEGVPPLCSVFVALQDISREMGPTMILKGTHQKMFHQTIKATQESYDSSGNIEVLQVATGSSMHSDEAEGCKSAPNPSYSEEDLYSKRWFANKAVYM